MTGESSKSANSAFAGVTRGCTHAALWMVVAFAWCIRRTMTPLAKSAGKVESWALLQLGERAE